MLALGKGVFLLPILWMLAAGTYHVTYRLALVIKKPPESDQIFEALTSTASLCTYLCIQNMKCLTLTYDINQLRCKGYQTHTERDTMRQTMKAWQVIYKG